MGEGCKTVAPREREVFLEEPICSILELSLQPGGDHTLKDVFLSEEKHDDHREDIKHTGGQADGFEVEALGILKGSHQGNAQERFAGVQVDGWRQVITPNAYEGKNHHGCNRRLGVGKKDL